MKLTNNVLALFGLKNIGLFVLFISSQTIQSQTESEQDVVAPSSRHNLAVKASAGSSAQTAHLLNFNAISTKNGVELFWSTGAEHNNDYFAVEKSRNNIDFETAVMVKGAGSSNVLLDYFEIDYNPFGGLSYYRLKVTDRNGKISYSPAVPVNFKLDNKGNFIPVSRYDEEIDIDLSGVGNEEVLVVLKNKDGQETYGKIFVKKEGKNIIATDGYNKLEPGAYLVLASSRNELFAQKIIIR